MTPVARISAAIEVLDDIANRRRPAADALKDWGLAHRFAGSKDRRAIGDLVFDALRHKSSSAFAANGEDGRAIMLGLFHQHRGLDIAAIEKLFSGERFAPLPLSDEERAALAEDRLAEAPDFIRGDYPEWIAPNLARIFGAEVVEELQALAEPAPLDLRVNTLKAEPDHAAKEVTAEVGRAPERPALSTLCLRLPLEPERGEPHIASTESFLKGHVEIQDLGSQLAAEFAGARPGMQVLDFCAGGGGKTLALAAAMQNHGQIFAYDSDRRRLAPIHDRLTRSGVRNVQVRTPRPNGDVLDDLEGRMDLVLIDAPCTGTGTWRRNPDAKWRIRPGSLAERNKDQALVLDAAERYVKKGGRLVYITCSVLEEENSDQIAAFLETHPSFGVVPPAEVVHAFENEAMTTIGGAARLLAHGLLLTPRSSGTDGFFVSVLTRAG
ncbi:RsmB/NOP family class I SAM-dependent RNA methyltransferase [Kaistia dalseonensis]|uniref:16S rRNA (Cytosine967-C5)-methyltransferase n=1 Tax=Kaistia dalseonensis TaxID=410840 RepID=A0ABU0H2E3_9HYPH|nr:RsmB/NOP family class I SAM-dependent RNA methyltransferase [Kaistia dalseonensis]MCX5493905.1 RsmB/NOP family class I SAM-dependent RNA methyltransferase [Kaistia dalseonensis]MDQ0436471.1 16S rRNA (cytosine967-C5)-methyltransferase [Kaistia dalseonensis]